MSEFINLGGGLLGRKTDQDEDTFNRDNFFASLQDMLSDLARDDREQISDSSPATDHAPEASSTWTDEMDKAWRAGAGTPLSPPREFVALALANPDVAIEQLLDRATPEPITAVLPYAAFHGYWDDYQAPASLPGAPYLTWREVAGACHEIAKNLNEEHGHMPLFFNIEDDVAVVYSDD